jgi:trigger factor
MKTTVKHLSDTRVLVTITLGAAELEAAEQVALKKLAKNVKVDGFRKGHVPIALVKKNVDPNELGQETVENALSRAVADG